MFLNLTQSTKKKPRRTDKIAPKGPKKLQKRPQMLSESSSKSGTLKFGCSSKSKLKTGLVKDIVRGLDNNILEKSSAKNIDFGRSNVEVNNDMQRPLLSDNLNIKPVPVITRIKDHGYALDDNCQTQPKRKQFIEFDSEDTNRIRLPHSAPA